MSFLPGSLTPALPRSYRRKVISPFRRSFCFEIGICFIWIFLRNSLKNKKADYTKHHKSAEAALSLQRMFYVIGFLIQSRVLRSPCPRQQNQRRGGAVRYFRCIETVSGNPDLFLYYVNIFSCMWNKFPRYHYTRTNTLCQFWEL